jgi:hypothetical protein
MVNWMPEWTMRGSVSDSWRDYMPLFDSLGIAVFLMGMGVLGGAYVLGLANGDDLQRGFVILAIVASIAWFVGFTLSLIFQPVFPGRRFRDAPVTHLGRLALFILAILAAFANSDQSDRIFGPEMLLVIAAALVGAGIVQIPRLLRSEEDEVRLPPPPPLGVALAGGSAIMVANTYLA